MTNWMVLILFAIPRYVHTHIKVKWQRHTTRLYFLISAPTYLEWCGRWPLAFVQRWYSTVWRIFEYQIYLDHESALLNTRTNVYAMNVMEGSNRIWKKEGLFGFGLQKAFELVIQFGNGFS